MNKKTLIMIAGVVIVIVAIILVCLLGKNGGSNKNIEGSLDTLMTKLYEGIPEDELPEVFNTEVTAENIEYYLGTSDIKYTEALASEPLMRSIAHSVVLLRLTDKSDAKNVVEKIKTNVDPRKWICVEVESQNVKVASRGDLVVLIMDNEVADKMLENFNNL